MDLTWIGCRSKTEVGPGLMSRAEIEALSGKALEQLIAAKKANILYLQGRIAELKGASGDADGRSEPATPGSDDTPL